MDLTGYIGKKISVEFRTADCIPPNPNTSSSTNCVNNTCTVTTAAGTCTYVFGSTPCVPVQVGCSGHVAGTHSAYAYIDAYCSPLNVVAPVFCTGSSSVQVCAPAGYASYSWPSGQPGITGSLTSQCVTVNNPISGTTYTVNMISFSGCPTTTTIKLMGLDYGLKDTTVCANSKPFALSLTPTIAGNYTYSWSPATDLSCANCQNPVYTPNNTSTTYTVTLTDLTSGCSKTKTITININPQPNVSAGPNQTLTCIPTNVILTGTTTAGILLSWDNGVTTTTNSINSPGISTLTATDPVTSCSSTSTIQVFPNIGPPNGIVNVTNSITCTNSIVAVSITSTTTPISVLWSGSGIIGSTTTASTTVSQAGTYTVTITNPANLCSQSYPVVVTTNTNAPTLSVSPTNSITCTNTSVAVSITTTSTPISILWSGSGIIGSTTSPSTTVSQAGTYTVTITNPINSCSASYPVVVSTNTIAPPLSVSATSSVITCSITSSTITATSSLTNTLTWITPSGSTAANPVNAIIAGNYIVTIKDATNGCSTTKTITINTNTVTPNVNAGVTAIIPCSSPTITLLGSSTSTDPVIYSWIGPNAGSITSGANTSNPTINSSGIYTLTVTNTITGCSATSTVNVTKDALIADFIADPMFGDVPLFVNFTNTSTGATTYTWTFGNGLGSNLMNPNTTYVNVGTYTVTLIASSGSCTDTITKIIITEDGFVVEIPNVFTPNSDNINDGFHFIKITGVKSAKGDIYNRWGQLLFTFNDLNSSWDGKTHGENCPDGTYFYIINIIDKYDKEHVYNGHLSLVR